MKLRIPGMMAASLICASALCGEAENIYDEHWGHALRFDPFKAATSGDYRFNDRVPGVS